MNTNRFTRRRFLVLTSALSAAFVLSCGAMAWAAWSVVGHASDQATTGVLSGVVLMDGSQDESAWPGATLERKAQVKNDGTLDLYARARIVCTWFDSDGPRPDLDSSLIEPTLSTSGWELGDDGWSYATSAVAPGEALSAPLMTQVHISEHADSTYAGLFPHVQVELECIQATARAAHDLWGRSTADDVVSTDEDVDGSVVFLGREGGFEFHPGSQDLLGTFDDVLPGESYSRYLAISNTSDADASITMDVSSVSRRDDESDASYDRRRAFLCDEVNLTVVDTSSDAVLYDGPAASSDASAPLLIDLGRFSSGELRRLRVVLSVSADAGNEYQGISSAPLMWDFQAGGDDSPASSAGLLPVTGDWSCCAICGVAAVSSLLALLVVLSRRRRLDLDSDQPDAGGEPK
ncbi:MAG: hypothetical protein LKI25_02265 [Atopobiaceae bacterium]|nr:hypothetical protein [Atopobiaceae bacterium]MCI2173031.1 hypothetical protein [Atopobiaceae bacterium]